MSELAVDIDQKKIAEFCKKHHIARLSFFGSILRDDFSSDSDVDVLVEFEKGRTPGLAFFGMQEDLSEIIGRKVDLNTAGFLSHYFRDQVVAEALLVYGSHAN
jgi:predicted nucleotidyltransferase